MKNLKKTDGILTQAYRGKNDYIVLKNKNSKEVEYRYCCFYNDKEVKELLAKDKKINFSIWYEDRVFFFFFKRKHLIELRDDNKLITLNNRINFKYKYNYLVSQYRDSIPNIIWWLKYSIFGELILNINTII